MMTDAAALDKIAELFRLPEWQIDGSGAEFIEAVAAYVGEVRNLGAYPTLQTLQDSWHEDQICYILIAEDGGWPTHAIGPFGTEELAVEYMDKDKWVQSWGTISRDIRDLEIVSPNQTSNT